MSNEKDLRKQFESIVGHELDPENEDGVVLRENVGVRSYFVSPAVFSAITSREIGSTGENTKRCSRFTAMSIGGISSTGPDGSIEFLLTDFMCGPFVFRAPAVIVGTVRGRRPGFVTVNYTFVRDQLGNAININIKIFTWRANGEAAPNTPFNWQCTVPAEENQS